MDTDTGFELRVLDGAQRGARTAVRSGVPLSIGATWNSDVVLRSAGAADDGAELMLDGDGIEVHARLGRVRAGAATLAAGEHARVPWYTPITIGDTTVALGELGGPAWSTLFGSEAAAAAGARGAAARGRRPWPRWLVRVGAALAAVSLSVLALAVAIAPAPPSAGARALRAQAALGAAGFDAVTVKADDSGELIVRGYLETLAQRARAERLLADAGMAARFEVWVDEQVASSVAEVFRLNGIAAEVESAGAGTVRVHTRVADGAALQRVQATARRDIAGLSQIVMSNQAPARRPSPVPRVDDPGKRIAAVVGNDPAHVVTVDGTRYFAGAMLPTGHRIVGIVERDVLLEREGEHSKLSF